MRDDRIDTEIEEIIRASMKMTDVPTPELNDKLKAALYQQEAVLQKRPAAHTPPTVSASHSPTKSRLRHLTTSTSGYGPHQAIFPSSLKANSK